MAANKKRVRSSKKWFGVALIPLILIIFSIAVYLVLIQRSQPEQSVEVPNSPKGVDVTPGGESTAEYENRLERYNLERYQEAEEKGDAFIPTVSSRVKDEENLLIEEKKEEKKEEKPEVVSPESLSITRASDRKAKLPRSDQKKTGLSESDQEKKDQLTSLYMEQMENVWNSVKTQPTAQSVSVFAYNKADTEMTAQMREPAESSGASSVSELGLKVGDVVYAVNDIKLNSDVPGPVKATVISGKYNNSSLIGSFKRMDKHLVLEFNTLVTPEGMSHSINSVAVNPDVPEYAIRSRVNNRTIQRWGGLIAASFLEGFAKSVSERGVETHITDNGTVTQSHPDYDTADQLWIAGGSVASQLSEKANQNFDRPPTVFLDPGQPLGVLILGL